MAGGGKVQVPCLLICEKGKSAQWLYESQDIIHFLKQQPFTFFDNLMCHIRTTHQLLTHLPIIQ